MKLMIYAWGTERPERRKKRLLDLSASLESEERKLDEEYKAAKERLAIRKKRNAARLLQVEFLSPDGVYDSSRAELLKTMVENEALLEGPEESPKGRGRPRSVFGPKPRKSRAKNKSAS